MDKAKITYHTVCDDDDLAEPRTSMPDNCSNIMIGRHCKQIDPDKTHKGKVKRKLKKAVVNARPWPGWHSSKKLDDL